MPFVPFAFGTRVAAAALTGSTIQLVDKLVTTSNLPAVTLSLPSGYTRAKGCFSGRSDAAATAASVFVRLNSDSGAHYNYIYTQSNNGTTTTADLAGLTAMLAGTITAATSTASYAGSGSFTLDDVQGGTVFPTLAGTATAFVTTANMYDGVYTGQWLSTAAVTTVTFALSTGNWVAGSSFSLYGMA